jgi:threonine/homoserine/homoserine lactone efflux protein
MVESLVDGVLAGYGIAIPVGAIAVLIVTTGMRCGFACAASAGAGAATADLIYALVAVIAGVALAEVLEPWAQPIRLASAAVLIAIAVTGLLRQRRLTSIAVGAVVVRSGELARTYGRFLGLTIINPLTVVYFASMVLGTTAGTTRTRPDIIVFVAGAFAASLSWQLFLAVVGAVARRGLSPRFRTVATVTGNVVILGLAARILLQPLG